MNENEVYKYDAFISYRHTEPDKTIAEKLHRMLESFKVPRSLIKKGSQKKVGRVFRDRDELPTSSNLADNISDALAHSEHLIVICSPRTPQSQWVMKEIETFSKLHGQERILALLIEGEPFESFPEPLRFVKRQVVCGDGSIKEQVEEVEPLAADIRAGSVPQMKKKLKVEILRLLAPVLNCRFDDLKQRHRERIVKRILTLSISLSLFFLGFGSFSAWQAWQIKQKSDLLEQQVQKTLEGQSLYMANISTQLFGEGDRRTAIMVAREALPTDLEDPERPYVEEAEYALGQALQVYKTDNRVMPDIALKHDNVVNFIKLSFDGKTAVTSARDGYLYIWETDYGTLLNKYFIGEKYPDRDSLAYIDDHTIVYIADNALTCLNLNTMKVNWEYDGYITRFTLNPDRSGVVLVDESVFLLDTRTGEVLFEHPIEDYLTDEGYVSITSQSMDHSGRYFCLGTNGGQALLFDLENRCLLGDFRTDNDQINSVAVSDGILAVASSDFSMEEINLLSKGKGILDVFDFNGNKVVERQFDYSSIRDLRFSPYDENLLIFVESEKINVMNISDDTLPYTFINGGDVTDYIIWEGFVVSSSYDGTIRFWVTDDTGWEYFPGRIELSQGITDFDISSGVQVASYEYSNKAVILRNLQNEAIVRLAGHDNTICDCSFSPDGTRLLSYTYNTGQIVLWDWKTREISDFIETDSELIHVCFIESGKKIFASSLGGRVSVYDAQTMKLLAQETYAYSVEKESVSPDGSLCAFETWEGVQIVNTHDLSPVSLIEDGRFDEILFLDHNSRVILVSNYDSSKVYSTQSGQELHAIPEKGIRDAAAHEDLLAFIYPDNTIRLLDSQSWEERYILDDFDVAALRVLYDDEGRYLFVSMDDHSLRCYDTETGKLIGELKGMSQATEKIVFSDDHTLLITQGETNDAVIWQWENRKKLGYLDRLITVSPDFETLLGSHSEELLLIPFYDTRMLIEEAEKQLDGRTLTDRERADLFISK